MTGSAEPRVYSRAGPAAASSATCAALALLLAAAVGALPAQDRARLQARSDSLLREWRIAQAIADMTDSVERARGESRSDTIRVGPLRIIAAPSPLPLREAAERAWPAIDSLFGSAAARLAEYPYVMVPIDPDTSAPRPQVHSGLPVPWDLPVGSLRDLLWANLPLAPDGALSAWLGGPLRPWPRRPGQLDGVYRELVTAPSTPARRCLLGDLDGCRAVLDLAGPTDALDRWYPTGAERRALATGSFAGGFDRGASAAAFRACAGGNDVECAELLRSLPDGSLPRPLGYAARDAFLKVALRSGGRDAYARLTADTAASLSLRLTTAAEQNLDTLVARWRGEVVASRPAPVMLPRFAVWVALGWTAVFGACALRSSRWRVG